MSESPESQQPPEPPEPLGPKPKKARLFYALDLPEPTREQIVEWQRRAGGDRALRPVAAENLHITLAFLGWSPEGRIGEAVEVLRRIRPRAVEARLLPDPVPLPERRPRLLALDTPSPAADVLQAELSDALVAAGLYEPEERPFWPHVTAFRVRRAKRGSSRPVRLEAMPPPLRSGADGHVFGSVRIALYRSDLRPDGARYSRLAATELPPPGGPDER